MITRRHLKAVFVCVGGMVLAASGVVLVQLLSEMPESHVLTLDAPTGDLGRGRVVLSLSSAMVTLAAASAGSPLKVESSFDPDVYALAQQYQGGDREDWTYRLDFHEKSVLHISVLGTWLGKRSPVVTVLIPADLPFDLEAKMQGGYLVMDFADLDLSTANVELDRGVLHIFVSDPMDVPMERLSVHSRIGTTRLDRLGNASPRRLDVQHRLGAAQVILDGQWRADADVDFQVSFATGELRLADNVRIDGLGRTFAPPAEREIPLPTLRIGTRAGVGGIRVID